MDILQYFETEYNSLNQNIDAATNTLLEVKQVVTDFALLEKEIIHLIINFRLSVDNVDKSLEIIEHLASHARNLLNSSSVLRETIQKTMTY